MARLREECGVFGIFDNKDAAALTALGLHALQHRGQEGCGIVTFDNKNFYAERRLGLVGDNFTKGKVLDKISNESVILESSISENTIFKDALEVLVDLGYRVSDARTQINEVINSTENDEDISVENLLREVFKRAR